MTAGCGAWTHDWDTGRVITERSEITFTCTVCGVQQRLPTHLCWEPETESWADPRPAPGVCS